MISKELYRMKTPQHFFSEGFVDVEFIKESVIYNDRMGIASLGTCKYGLCMYGIHLMYIPSIHSLIYSSHPCHLPQYNVLSIHSLTNNYYQAKENKFI